MKLVAKMLEARDREWFGENICHLIKSGNMLDGELMAQNFFMNEVNLKLDGNRTMVITLQHQRMRKKNTYFLKKRLNLGEFDHCTCKTSVFRLCR